MGRRHFHIVSESVLTHVSDSPAHVSEQSRFQRPLGFAHVEHGLREQNLQRHEVSGGDQSVTRPVCHCSCLTPSPFRSPPPLPRPQAAVQELGRSRQHRLNQIKQNEDHHYESHEQRLNFLRNTGQGWIKNQTKTDVLTGRYTGSAASQEARVKVSP